MVNSVSALLFLFCVSISTCDSVPHPGHGGPPPPKRPPPRDSHSSPGNAAYTESATLMSPYIPPSETPLLALPPAAHDHGQQPLLTGFQTRVRSESSTSTTRSASLVPLTSLSLPPTSLPLLSIPDARSSNAAFPVSTVNAGFNSNQVSATTNRNIESLCLDPSTSTILLGSITDFNSTTGEPTIDFQPTCRHRRPSLLHPACPALIDQAKICHSLGKKLALGIGGPGTQIAFSDRGAAVIAAVTLWNVLKDNGGEEEGRQYLRPLGSVAVDALIVHKDVRPGAYFDVLADTLRLLARTADRPFRTKTRTRAGGATLYRRPQASPVAEKVGLADEETRICDLGRMEESRFCREWQERRQDGRYGRARG